MPNVQNAKYASVKFTKRKTIGKWRYYMKKSKEKWRINWQFIIVWLLMLSGCLAFWYFFIFWFVKLISK